VESTIMYNESELPSFERLEQMNLYLDKVGQLAQAHGKEWVEKILSLGDSKPDVLLSKSNDTTSIDSKQELGSGVFLIDQVKVLGIKINQQIIDLIKKSTYAQVETAITKYKRYRKVDNPEGLFWRILTNEHE